MKKIFSLASLLLLVVVVSSFLPLGGGYKPGDVAADFKLKNIDGKMLSLADMGDAKGFIVTFTCNHCPYSKLYEDRLIALHNQYASKGYPVVAINPNDAVQYPDDSFDKMVERAKEKGFPFAYLHDETQEIAKKFGAEKTPHIFLIQKAKKKLKVVYVGAIDNNAKDAAAVTEKYLENALNDLLAGKEVKTNSTKAIGCSVKWKK